MPPSAWPSVWRSSRRGSSAAGEVGDVAVDVRVRPVLRAEIEVLEPLLELVEGGRAVPDPEGVELPCRSPAGVLDAQTDRVRRIGEVDGHDRTVVAPRHHQRQAAVERTDLGVHEVVGDPVPHLVDEIGLGDQHQRLGLPLESRGHGHAGSRVERQPLLIDVGDVHRVGGGAPADPRVAAEHDAGHAGEGDAEGVHRRPAVAVGAGDHTEVRLVERARVAEGEVGVVGEDRPAGVGDLAARHPPVAAAPALPPLQRVAEQGDLRGLGAVAGRERRRARGEDLGESLPLVRRPRDRPCRRSSWRGASGWDRRGRRDRRPRRTGASRRSRRRSPPSGTPSGRWSGRCRRGRTTGRRRAPCRSSGCRGRSRGGCWRGSARAPRTREAGGWRDRRCSC